MISLDFSLLIVQAIGISWCSNSLILSATSTSSQMCVEVQVEILSAFSIAKRIHRTDQHGLPTDFHFPQLVIWMN